MAPEIFVDVGVEQTGFSFAVLFSTTPGSSKVEHASATAVAPTTTLIELQMKLVSLDWLAGHTSTQLARMQVQILPRRMLF